MEIEVVRFRVSGDWVARPKGCLGPSGQHPFPWTACYGITAKRARANFLKMHKVKL